MNERKLARELNAATADLNAGRILQATARCRQILRAAPGQPDALKLLGIGEAQAGRSESAVKYLRAAAQARPDDMPIRYNLALALDQAGRVAEAEMAYRSIVARLPGHLPSWMNLGGLLLRADRPAEAQHCFGQVVEAEPGFGEGWTGLGLCLQKLGRFDDATAAFRTALTCAPDRAELIGNLGGALLDGGSLAEAAECFRRAAALQPDAADGHVSLAVALCRLGDIAGALSSLEEALRLQPGHTRALAVQASALHASGQDAAAAALVDFDRLMLLRQIEPPAIYPQPSAFNQALADHVRQHPTLLHERAGKTTRNGSQTGELLAGERGPVDLLEPAILDAVDSYQSTVPVDPEHPFLAQRPAALQLTAWGTVLQRQGHQDPHNHPSGWLSGVYYVALPEVVQTEAAQHAGWIEFGRPDPALQIGPRPPVRLIQPEEGLMVLFPSYLWHRTIPFESDEERISIAFDVLPA